MPARIPNASAAPLTSPTACSPPGSGAMAIGSVSICVRSATAASSEKRGMRTDPTSIRGGERMFAHRGILFKGLAIACLLIPVCALLAIAGCGGDDEPAGSPAGPSGNAGPADTAEADPADLEVIEGWSQTLSEGDVEGAAEYFATPSTAQNGPQVFQIESLEDAIRFNESLPCAAEVVSARTQGELTTATFELSDRPGGGCGPGTGGTASTSFEIADGEIVEWRRIDEGPASEGGDQEDSSPV
jgi:hypothetical protein